jgi:hypothetical protein
VGVINMNGRVYDPLIGRFMSADPINQAPYNLKAYNRYSYVWNNSLKAWDPTGYVALPLASFGIAFTIDVFAQAYQAGALGSFKSFGEFISSNPVGIARDAAISGLAAAIIGGRTAQLAHQANQGLMRSGAAVKGALVAGVTVSGAASVTQDIAGYAIDEKPIDPVASAVKAGAAMVSAVAVTGTSMTFGTNLARMNEKGLRVGGVKAHIAEQTLSAPISQRATAVGTSASIEILDGFFSEIAGKALEFSVRGQIEQAIGMQSDAGERGPSHGHAEANGVPR